ncbi:RDD family protein [Flavobacterium sp. KJJ]|uniref:RDD family protein n=1 Tax=Flavobacterium sp. KJJ TaxID=1270193 RepID=UPI0009E78515|nr:RDD family protein [Flavobacterium sp. KJJ]
MDNELLTDYASKKTRFLNLVIDNFISWILFIITILFFEDWVQSNIGKGSALINISCFLLLRFIYYMFFESLFGRTPGKIFTATKVIDENDKKPNFKKLLIRNLSRFIPFDAISFAVSDIGWHDSISKTSVINT